MLVHIWQVHFIFLGLEEVTQNIVRCEACRRAEEKRQLKLGLDPDESKPFAITYRRQLLIIVAPRTQITIRVTVIVVPADCHWHASAKYDYSTVTGVRSM